MKKISHLSILVPLSFLVTGLSLHEVSPFVGFSLVMGSFPLFSTWKHQTLKNYQKKK